MNLFRKFFKKSHKKTEQKHDKKREEDNSIEKRLDENKIPISSNIDETIRIIKREFRDCDDLVVKEFLVGTKQDSKFAIVYIDGIIDKVGITENITIPLMQTAREIDPKNIKDDLYNFVKDRTISSTEMKEIEVIEEGVDAILTGDTMLLIDNYDKIIVISSKSWQQRGLSEPQAETLVRGPRDGFNETIKTNITSVRRRIRDTKLKVKMMKVGRRSKTDVAVLYIEDIANADIVKEIQDRINAIDTDVVLESSYIEEFIEDNNYSIFPQLENTERPDAVAAGLYDGKIAILIDNTPFALLAPVNISVFFDSSEDYYERWIMTLLLRPIRYIGALVAMLAPAAYIAVTSFHPGILPTQLALFIASTRVTVPFPAFIEAFLLQATIELLRESGSRISGPIGTTIGIVGGLVIGQAAVAAGIVSPSIVIIAALTTIATFTAPNYSFAITLRTINFIMIFLASALGFYGIMLGIIGIGIHLSRLSNYGTPYLAPFGILGKFTKDLKDTVIRVPFPKMLYRPQFGRLQDRKRMSDDNGE